MERITKQAMEKRENKMDNRKQNVNGRWQNEKASNAHVAPYS